MSRKILFDKKSENASVQATPKNNKKGRLEHPLSTTAIQDIQKKPDTLLEWLKAHDLIKIRTLCLKAGVDPGSFHRWMNVTKEIPDAAIKKITPILKDYGYAL